MATLKAPSSPLTSRKKAYPKAVMPQVQKFVGNPVGKPVYSVDKKKILELINRRQRQIIVHSVIYYRYNDSLISDYTFDTLSEELVTLQKMYIDIAKNSVFWNEMQDFTGETGFHLTDNSWGIRKAEYLLNLRDRGGFKNA